MPHPAGERCCVHVAVVDTVYPLTLYWTRCCTCGNLDNAYEGGVVEALGRSALAYLDRPGYKHGPHRPAAIAVRMKDSPRHAHCWHPGAREDYCCRCNSSASPTFDPLAELPDAEHGPYLRIDS